MSGCIFSFLVIPLIEVFQAEGHMSELLLIILNHFRNSFEDN